MATILILDDQKDIIEILKHMLKSFGKIIPYDNFAEGSCYLQEHNAHIDLVVLDGVGPQGNNRGIYGICKTYKKPTVWFSGGDKPSWIEEHDFVQKPDFKKLHQIIETKLNKEAKKASIVKKVMAKLSSTNPKEIFRKELIETKLKKEYPNKTLLDIISDKNLAKKFFKEISNQFAEEYAQVMGSKKKDL